MSVVQPLGQMPAAGPGSAGGSPYDALVRPDGMVHRTLFTDPVIFEQEMTRIFGGTWVFLSIGRAVLSRRPARSSTMGVRGPPGIGVCR